MTPIDLRSDTVTRPSKPMLEAMMNAKVGDDVYGEDPTVNALQDKIAVMFGKEAALFVPSGTMGNEICIKVHTQPGDEIIVEEGSHIVVYETAAPSLLAGVQIKSLPGKKGMLDVADIKSAKRPSAYYMPRTSLICLENTHGSSGGSVLPLEGIKAIREYSLKENIPIHLDGARLWNASVASGISVGEYAKYFDSVSVCFSKGLSAPVGSMIVGSKSFIENARRYRKIFGGGMRQAGILAAAALYAVEHNINRLADDHRNAKMFVSELISLSKLKVNLSNIQTNMIFIEIIDSKLTQAGVLSLLREHGVLLTPERHSEIRAVMHLDVSESEVLQAASIIKKLFS